MIAIEFNNIGKCYKMKDKSNFWALRNFSYSVEPGEIIGVVGSNGAGKSTLLKICSRVVQPTTGYIDINGRVGALLEVGTGFHPELTGMENIFFNGAILGIPRKEINEKIDDIIKFAGIEKFIDTPVKRYSSGMYTRLAFAIAAQLDVENMIVDEVLAVGDSEFQKKCLSKMDNMSKSGRTILFVSHDMTAITRLCNKAIWLQNGEIALVGEPNDVVQAYITHAVPRSTIDIIQSILDKLPEDPTIKITDIKLTQRGNLQSVFFRDYPIEITIAYTILRKEPGTRVFVRVLSDHGCTILKSYHDTQTPFILEPGEYVSTMTIPGNILSNINYELGIGALVFNQRSCTGTIGEGVRIPLSIESIEPTDCYPDDAYQYRPLIKPHIQWTTVKL